MAVASGLSYQDAAILVGITKHQVMESVRQVPDEVFQEMIRTMSRGLLLRSYLKAMEILESISPEDISQASLNQKTTAAATLLDRATDKLGPTAQVIQGPSSVGFDDIESLLQGIQGKVQKLKIHGLKAELIGKELGNDSVHRAEPTDENGLL